MRGVNRKSFHVKPVVSAFFALIFVPHVICCSTFCYSSKLFLSRSFFCSSFHCRRFVFRSFIDRLIITWNLNCFSTILQLCRQFIFIFGLISHGMEKLLVCCFFLPLRFCFNFFLTFLCYLCSAHTDLACSKSLWAYLFSINERVRLLDNDLFFCSTLLFLHSMFYVFICKVFGLPNLPFICCFTKQRFLTFWFRSRQQFNVSYKVKFHMDFGMKSTKCETENISTLITFYVLVSIFHNWWYWFWF